MDFGNFGTVSFTKEAKAVPFVEYLTRGKVMTTKCETCGRKYFPPRMDCPYCIDSKVEWFEITGKGKLLTFTQVHYGPLGFEEDAPYILGIVDFTDGVRILSRISKAIDPDSIKIGMDLKIKPVKLSEEKVTYEFVTV